MAVGDAEADALHFRKNRPELPPVEFPPYEHHAFPAWVYHENEEPRLVQNDDELANFLSRGWATNPHAARAAYETHELSKRDAAFQRASDDRRMSDTAKAEHEAADSAADDHVLDLPVPPADKKPRKAKE